MKAWTKARVASVSCSLHQCCQSSGLGLGLEVCGPALVLKSCPDSLRHYISRFSEAYRPQVAENQISENTDLLTFSQCLFATEWSRFWLA